MRSNLPATIRHGLFTAQCSLIRHGHFEQQNIWHVFKVFDLPDIPPSHLVHIVAAIIMLRDYNTRRCIDSSADIAHCRSLHSVLSVAGCRDEYSLRPLTHAPETGSRNRRHRPKFDAKFRRQFFRADARLLTSTGPEGSQQLQKSCIDTETGAGIWHRSYGAEFWSRFLERVSGA